MNAEIELAELPENCSAASRRRVDAHRATRREAAREVDPSPENDTTELEVRKTIPQLVKTFEAARNEVLRGYKVIADAQDALNAVFYPDAEEWSGIEVCKSKRRDRVNFHKPDETIKHLEEQVWESLISMLEVRRFMSIKAATKLNKQLSERNMPPITLETVLQMATQLRDRIPEMLNDAIREVHDWLRPPGSRYKRNSEFEVPRRIVLSYAVDNQWSGGFHVNYDRDKNFTALENAFNALDGKGFVNKHWKSELSQAIDSETKKVASSVVTTSLFEAKCYRNRNMHLRFLRLDLLEKFNAIAGGMRLRGSTVAQDVQPR
jgi:hypothetical protein